MNAAVYLKLIAGVRVKKINRDDPVPWNNYISVLIDLLILRRAAAGRLGWVAVLVYLVTLKYLLKPDKKLLGQRKDGIRLNSLIGGRDCAGRLGLNGNRLRRAAHRLGLRLSGSGVSLHSRQCVRVFRRGRNGMYGYSAVRWVRRNSADFNPRIYARTAGKNGKRRGRRYDFQVSPRF